ncbi:Major facilitator superfamily [Moorella glycerini]|uniref:Niacin/nicotinamide transporter NaiP n=1 Tax=Neomoorella stamsii TaxID=1266720 RepID=A0A9X7J136_9FIRM|nr:MULTISPECIES: MFS transporter [Moorella]PRR71507.1 putative niacin/nicotinamide transporter NaiP [Moorella stamsii]CEP68718.1 Major facilitator superfamily [Moorella glycerini]
MSRNWAMLITIMFAWMADSGDSLLYSYVLGSVAKEWNITPALAASIGFLPMAAAVVGGPLFGFIADKYGRKKSLLSAMFLVALSGILVGISQNPTQMVLSRLLVGLVLGGIWTAGMTLISEIWDPKSRGKAVAVVQVGFPLGYLYASILTYFVSPSFGWRGAYIASAIPSLLIFIAIWFFVNESPLWLKTKGEDKKTKAKAQSVSIQELFQKQYATKTLVASLIAFLGMYGYWAVMTWIPSYLAVVGFNAKNIPLWTFFILSGAVVGYLTHGTIGDRYGRKKAFGLFFLGTAIFTLVFGLLPVYLAKAYNQDVARTSVVLIGPILSFFTGYFSGYGAYYAELFPTRIRGSAVGFCFNVGRIGTSIGPGITGALAAFFGVGGALAIASISFIISAVLIFLLPETAGISFEADTKSISS